MIGYAWTMIGYDRVEGMYRVCMDYDRLCIDIQIEMPRHQRPLEQLVDPFSIPAQMNNLGVLIVAYVTVSLQKETQCEDNANDSLLWFIYYGSTMVCGGTFLFSVLYMLGCIDKCINTFLFCNEVCLTINTFTILLLGVLYHLMATIYALEQAYFHVKSHCVELQMFKRITSTIYSIWVVCIVLYLIFVYCKKRNQRMHQDQQLKDGLVGEA